MSKYFILSLISLFLISCDKDNNNEKVEKDYPKTVTFDYNGNSVTHGVIKKDYYVDSNGNSMEIPVTKLWLDRNLGAQRAAIIINDSLASGDLFQWGRLADGHQKRRSQTVEILSSNIIPGHDKFIISPLNSNDWLENTNDSLWNDLENTNCSCPDGWRVPTIDELGMELNSWKTKNMDGAFDSSLKWVSTGNRDNHGTERYSEYWGFIWTSTTQDNGMVYSLAIIGSNTAEIITSARIFGMAVRCVKDY